MEKSLACRVCSAGTYCQMCHKNNECGSRCSTPKSCLEGMPLMELMTRGRMLHAELTQEELDLHRLIGVPASDCNFKVALERAEEATIRTALDEITGKPETKTKELALRRRLAKLIRSTAKEEPMRTKVTDVPISAAERKDPALHIEMQTLRAEREERLAAEEAQTERERLIAQSYEVAGQIKAVKMMSEFGDVTSLMWLKQIKESKIYRDIPGIGTWEKYCDYVGVDRHTTDQNLLNLATFGEAFIASVTNLGVSYRDLRKLRQLTHDGTVQVDDNVITIGDRAIEVDPENTDDLRAAIEWILDENTGLTKRVEKLEKQTDAIIKEETKGLQSEIKAYKERIQKLEAFEPDEQDREWAVKQMKTIEEAAGAFQLVISRFVIDPRLEGDRHLQALVNQHLQEAEMALHDVRKKLDAVVDMFND